jgi:hypothetical protein
MPSRSTLIRGWAFRRSGWGAVHPWCHLGDPWPPVRLSLHAHAFSQRLGSAHRVAHGGGLVGLHARQAGDPGYSLLGTVGFVLASVGDLLLATLGPFVSSAVPGGAFPFMMVMVVYLVVVLAAGWGMILLGVATLRAALLPLPWRVLPLAFFLLDVPLTTLAGALIETVGVSVLMYVQPLLLGLGWALLGYALWSEAGGNVLRRPSPAR